MQADSLIKSIWEDGTGSHRRVHRDSPEARLILETIDVGPSSVVVELGAGTGEFTIPIAKRLEELGGNSVVFAFEFSHRLIETLEKRATDCGLNNMIRAVPLSMVRAGELPLQDGKVDRVLSTNALQYLKEPSGLYKEVARVLKPGGLLYLVDWHRNDLISSLPRTAPAYPDEVERQITAAGLKSPEVVDRQPNCWIMRAQKAGQGAASLAPEWDPEWDPALLSPKK